MGTKHIHYDLILLWAAGNEIEVQIESSGMWVLVDTPTWGPDCKYRVKPRLPGISWEAVSKEYNWMAQDAYGVWLLFKAKPKMLESGYCDIGQGWLKAAAFSSFDPGTFTPREQFPSVDGAYLLQRPGYEGE